MTFTRARIFDALALLTVIIVVTLDQWTKALVVQHLSPPDIGPRIPLVGDYLVLFYIRNNGAAFSLFDNNSIALVVLIAAAIAIIVYLYLRMLNSGPLVYKLIFGMIIGGAVSNLIDRAHHSGYVVDFISFRIPQIGFYFAVFNLADAAISVGVFLLFVVVLFSSLRRPEEKQGSAIPQKIDDGQAATTGRSQISHSKEQDAQP
ncbi:MAG TPA: signal peptidase II [Ktedonobacteraceae bacterium]|nr:signal peptidase II [Ktedonobacteraceae bacterium]